MIPSLSVPIVLATRNPHKAEELVGLFRVHGIPAIKLSEMDPDGQVASVEETGWTLEENARLKARAVCKALRRPAAGDDTGLEVDALDGEPGVFSARFAGEESSYADNVRKLLTALAGLPQEKRTARFRTVLCYTDGVTELVAEGAVEGFVAEHPAGQGGFGYDPVFWIPSHGKTYGELSESEKNLISHRARAVAALARRLQRRV